MDSTLRRSGASPLRRTTATHFMSVAKSNNALPVNSRLEEYVIQSVLGIGGFGITYLARDTRLGSLVALKEYFPHAYAQRDSTNTIRPNTGRDTGDAENYRWGLQEFLKEARALAQFKHTNIVRVLRFLEANGTAYMAMEYEEGESLSGFLARHGGFLNEALLLNVFLPVLNGLQAVHDAGLLHLDIKPDNIYLRRNGVPMLIDFGSARQRSTANRSQKVALTPGYAALEQYPGHGDLGPGADVYSMSATLYRCITGQEPVDARERVNGLNKLHVDPLVPAARFERPVYSRHIRECVDAALQLKSENRPSSASALQNGLMGKSMSAATPPKSNASIFSSGQGFIGLFTGKEGKKRRIIPRGPIERLLVFTVFAAVLLLVTVRGMHATGHLAEGEEYDYLDRILTVSVQSGKKATRYVEENILGVKRAPEYIPPPSQRVARAAPAPKSANEKPVPVFESGKSLVSTVALTAPAVSLAFLQDGTMLAVALDDGGIQLRNAISGALVRTYVTALGVPGAVAASSDGQRLAFSAANYTIQIWDIEKNIFLGELPGHLDAILALAFSPDGQRLASASRDQTAMLWDVNSGQLLRDLSKPASEPLAMAFSPDGNRLAVSDATGGIHYWQMSDLREIAYVPTRDQPIAALAYSPDGKWFALGSDQGFLSLWEVSGKRPDRVLPQVPDTVHALAFSPDSKWLIVAGSDATLQLWDVETANLAQRYEGGNHQTYTLALSSDGQRIAAAGDDGKLTQWK
jgi:serine/threonine protein kinase/Tol biopolymer transport system component